MTTKSIKLLFIVTQNEWGGVQKYIYDLSTRLDKNTFSINVACGKEPPEELSKKLETKGIDTKKLSYLVRKINPIYDFLALIEIYKLIKKIKPDIIHLNSSKAGILGSIAGRLAKIPKIIYTAHGWVFNEPLPFWKKYGYLFAERITAPFKTKIICVSEFDRATALKNHIAPEKKLITIQNGIDINNLHFYDRETARNLLSKAISYKFTPSGNEVSPSGLEANKPVIGTIANLYKTKGLDYLLKAAAKLPDKTFIIIGQGAEKKNLENIMKNNNINNVILAGSLKNAYKYLKAFDIFVLPSVKEGFPYTILEALASGIPIIATKVGALPEILPGANLIEPKNTQALISSLKNTPLVPAIDINLHSLDSTMHKTTNLYFENL